MKFSGKSPNRFARRLLIGPPTRITLDMAGSMTMIAKRCFPRPTRVIDRFHVQRLAVEALQDIRIKYRWDALDQENDAIEQAKASQAEYQPELLANGDTIKQLLARSRYALYKKPNTWTESQRERAQLAFERFPDLKKAYDLAQELSNIFTNTNEKIYGLTRLAKWHEKVIQSGFKSFNTVARSIENHYMTIVIYFDNRSPMLRLNHSMPKSKLLEVNSEEFGMLNSSCIA